MRMLMNIRFHHEPLDRFSLGRKGRRVVTGVFEEIKPEAIYFTEQDERCGAIAIIDAAFPRVIVF